MNKIKVIYESLLKCPHCGFEENLTMPSDSCVYFHTCSNCSKVIKPLLGDCCVFCSYGSVKCPPIQTGNCCDSDI